MKANEYLGESHPFHFSRFTDTKDDAALVPLIRRPENLPIVVAGGWDQEAGYAPLSPVGDSMGGLRRPKKSISPMTIR